LETETDWRQGLYLETETMIGNRDYDWRQGL